MINILELEFATLRIYENFIVTECHEGVLLDVKKNRKVLEIARDLFNEQPFGYISHRVNSYAVDPMVYRESAADPLLVAIGVVSGSDLGLKNAQLEQHFYTNRNSFNIFNSLEPAISWIQQILQDHSKIASSNL